MLAFELDNLRGARVDREMENDESQALFPPDANIFFVVVKKY